MPSEWPLLPLGEVSLNFDTRRKPVKEAERVAGPYPYYGASGIVDFVDGYLFDGEYLLIAEDGENLRTRNTPIAFRARGKFWVNNHAHIIQGNAKASTRYLEYAVLSADIGPYLTGAVMPKLTQGNLNKILVPCPSIEIQNQVVDVLGALDDKIALLRETNATLEAIAQALFKSWFVDFDPVRARRDGCDPVGVPPEVADLFPSEFEDSEVGEIPKGWRVVSVGDVAEVIKGKSYKSSELTDSPTALVTLKSFARGGGFRTDGFKGYSGSYKPEQVLKTGDCVVAYTDVTQQAEVIGRAALVLPSPQHVTLVASLDVGVIRPRLEPLSSVFMYLMLRGERYISHIRGYTSGTTVLHLAKEGLPSFRFVLPPSELLVAFEDIAKPMMERAAINHLQAHEVERIRDTLLPRLMSGKLRIPEIQETVGVVAA